MATFTKNLSGKFYIQTTNVINHIDNISHPLIIDFLFANGTTTLTQDEKEKPCPNMALLSLYEEGIIQNNPNITFCKTASSSPNKRYILYGLYILQNYKKHYKFKSEIWQDILSLDKSSLNKEHNSQVDVLIAVWRNRHQPWCNLKILPTLAQVKAMR